MSIISCEGKCLLATCRMNVYIGGGLEITGMMGIWGCLLVVWKSGGHQPLIETATEKAVW